MGFRCSRWARHIAAVAIAVSLPSVGRAQAVVRGVLYDDASGVLVRGSVMLVDPRSDAAVVYASTDSTGAFSLQVGPGVYQIHAIRPGYVSVLSAPMSLQSGERLTIRVPIAQGGDPQHQIGVTEHVRPGTSAAALARNPAASAFASRRSLGMGLHYNHEQLLKNGEATLGEFLRGVPGLTVSDPSSMTSAQMSRNAGLPMTSSNMPGGACHIGWFVDGRRMDLPGQSDPLTDGLGLMHLDTIEGVEVFRGVAEMPAEFADPDLRCGAIAIWTMRG